jgi:hypothetical protein
MNEKTHWHLVRGPPADWLEEDSGILATGGGDGKSGLEEGWAGLDSATASTEVGIDCTSETEAGGNSEVGAGGETEVGTRIGSEDGAEAKSDDGAGRDSIELEEELEAELDSFELG